MHSTTREESSFHPALLVTRTTSLLNLPMLEWVSVNVTHIYFIELVWKWKLDAPLQARDWQEDCNCWQNFMPYTIDIISLETLWCLLIAKKWNKKKIVSSERKQKNMDTFYLLIWMHFSARCTSARCSRVWLYLTIRRQCISLWEASCFFSVRKCKRHQKRDFHGLYVNAKIIASMLIPWTVAWWQWCPLMASAQLFNDVFTMF